MVLTGENRNTQRKTCPSATSSATNPIWTVLGSRCSPWISYWGRTDLKTICM